MGYKRDYGVFYIKDETIRSINLIHVISGRGSVSRLAAIMGWSRQYASMVCSKAVGLSTYAMAKVMTVGLRIDPNENSRWGDFFSYNREVMSVHKNHPLFTKNKEMGEMPYTMLSPAADAKKDRMTRRPRFLHGERRKTRSLKTKM